MPPLPVKVSEAWDDREGPVIFTTVGQDGYPNAIYALCVAKYSEEMIVVANNYFSIDYRTQYLSNRLKETGIGISSFKK